MRDFDELSYLDDLYRNLAEVRKVIAENKDNRTKEVGDKVLVWDGSYNVDKNTGKKRWGIDPLFTNPAIVIKTNCDEKTDTSLDGTVFNLDLLLKFDSGEEVYTTSNMVKRIDKNNI